MWWLSKVKGSLRAPSVLIKRQTDRKTKRWWTGLGVHPDNLKWTDEMENRACQPSTIYALKHFYVSNQKLQNLLIVGELLFSKGLASYRKAETTFTFHFSFLTLSNAFLNINNCWRSVPLPCGQYNGHFFSIVNAWESILLSWNKKMKSESGFSFAIASQPLLQACLKNK